MPPPSEPQMPPCDSQLTPSHAEWLNRKKRINKPPHTMRDHATPALNREGAESDRVSQTAIVQIVATAHTVATANPVNASAAGASFQLWSSTQWIPTPGRLGCHTSVLTMSQP